MLFKRLTLMSEQNGQYFAANIFKCILMNDKFGILFQISLKFLPEGPIPYRCTDINGWHRPNMQQVIICVLYIYAIGSMQ